MTIPAHIKDLIPADCTVEDYKSVSTVHAPNGDLVAIVCGSGSAHRARLITTVPALLKAADNALSNGMMAPLAHGLDAMDLAVFPPRILPA